MPYSIETKDGIVIDNIPDDIAPDSQILKDRVAQERAKLSGGEIVSEADAPPLSERAQQELSVDQQQELLRAKQRQLQSVMSPEQSEGLLSATVQRERALASMTPEQRELVEDIGALEAAGIGFGRGLTNIGRAVGLVGQEGEAAKMGIESLRQVRPVALTGGEILGEAAPFIPFGAAAASIKSTAPRVASLTATGALEGGLSERGRGGDVSDQLISGVVTGAAVGAFPTIKIFKNAGKPTKAQAGIIKSLQENPRNPNLAKFIPETGKKSKALRDAVKQSGSPELVAVMKSSSPADKAAFNKMLNIVRQGKLDPVFADKVRVGDVVGKSLSNRLSDLKALNKRAGSLVDEVARKELKGNTVNISGVKSSFKQGLDDLRVAYDPKTGSVSFKGSALEGVGAGQARDLVKNLAKRLRRDVISAEDAHFMKRLIDQKVSFGKSDSGFSGQIDRNIKSLRKGLNDSISDKFPEYRKANSKYSETVNAINNFQDSIGGKVDLTSKEALGVSARRLTSNTQSRAKMLDSLDEIQEVLSKNGIRYKDDILTQTHVANAIDRRFKTQASTGFEKSAGKAAAEAVSGSRENMLIDLVGKAIDKVSGVTDDKAIETLIRITK